MTITDRVFNRLIVGAVALGFLSLLIVGVVAGWTMHRNQLYSRWVGHTYDVEQAISDYRILAERTETARRGFLISRDEAFYNTYRKAGADMPEAIERIRRLTTDNPAQQKRVEALAVLQKRQAATMELAVREVQAGRQANAIAVFRIDGTPALVRDSRALTVAMAQEETRLLSVRDREQRASAILLIWVLAAAGVLLLIVGAGSIYVILRYTRDLSSSRSALMVLNNNLEAAVDERTTDLKRANEEIQRFAYIVSHDLRSPLVNVMGFTSELDAAIPPLAALVAAVEESAPSLMTEEARLAVREDLPEAVGFIRSSTQKMDRLINAILKLSREGRRVLAAEPLDLTAMAQGVVDSLKHRTDELGARIVVAAPLPRFVGDRVALEQILSNLVENAVKYLKPGRPGLITITGEVSGGRVVLSVIDNGRGVEPRDHERIFDLFRRSGVQDQPGEGIGLAHVRATAYRLGGFITCESALDQGATFRVSLPANIPTEQDSK